MSARETALAGLKTTLGNVSGSPTVTRNESVPVKIPAGGLLALFDGIPGEPDVVLSPTTYYYEHRAEIEVIVQNKSAATRDTALDTLLTAISTAVNADTTLSSAVDLARLEAPEFEDTGDIEGADDLKAAIVPVILHYNTTDPLN